LTCKEDTYYNPVLFRRFGSEVATTSLLRFLLL
jgi:hypothetical protein